MQSSLLGAIERRSALLAPLLATPKPKQALRIYDGYREGGGRFVVDVYGTTLVVFDHAAAEDAEDGAALALAKVAMERLPFIETVVCKEKSSRDPVRRCGVVIVGEATAVCRAIVEDGVRYAVRLLAHHDSTFYLDTKNLRRYVRERAEGKSVLNAFAYTGSLGIAAMAGHGSRVVQTDKNRDFLTIAKDSCSLNGFPIQKASFIAADFFEVAARLRKKKEVFDFVIIDPPLFADSTKGRVDLDAGVLALLNKARPLVADEGRLIVVNNALFVSGAAFMHSLEAIAGEGYAEIETRVDVPEDCAPPLQNGATPPPSDPAPFNHPTKIAVLKMRRRDQRRPRAR